MTLAEVLSLSPEKAAYEAQCGGRTRCAPAACRVRVHTATAQHTTRC